MIFPPRVMAVYAVLNGNKDMFPFVLPALTREGISNFKLRDLSNSSSLFNLAHIWALQTQPDYMAFTDALRPYYTPDWAKY
jgi:hypothetical protein